MKRILLTLVICFLFFPLLYSQHHLSLHLDDPLYFILDYAAIKGMITHLPRSKPYPKSMIVHYMDRIMDQSHLLHPREQSILEALNATMKQPKTGILHGNIAYTGISNLCMLGLDETSEFRVNINRPEDWHMHNAINFYLRGDLGNNISYNGGFGATFDKVDPESFVPYSFTKEWDGFHIGFGESRYSIDGIESVPSFSFILENEITAMFFDNLLYVRLARLRRNWGTDEGSFYLSETARPFEGIELHAEPAPWLYYSYLVGSLGNWIEDQAFKIGGEDGEQSFQKMLTLEMLEFRPFSWFSISAVSAALWGKRFEIGYLSPLMYPLIHQNLHGDFDNVFLSIDTVITIPGYAHLYVSFLIDEMELTNPAELFSHPRNTLALQAGIRVIVPYVPFTLVTLQYTKIEPFVYAHYPEVNPSSPETEVDLSYTHDGENIGFHLPPNSDSLLLKVETMLMSHLFLSLQYRLIRHGTNDRNEKGDLAIYGDIEEYFHYDLADQYPDKHFLEDGLYDWNNIISLEATYRLKNIPLSFGFSYSFSHTFYVPNESGITPSRDKIKNIICLKMSVFR